MKLSKFHFISSIIHFYPQHAQVTQAFQVILAILFSWFRARGVCFKYMYAVAMPSRAGTQSFYKKTKAVILLSFDATEWKWHSVFSR